jgi:hypothetical protein
MASKPLINEGLEIVRNPEYYRRGDSGDSGMKWPSEIDDVSQ